MSSLRGFAHVALCLAVLCAAGARAEPRQLANARAQYENGEFMAALAQLDQAQKSPELSADDLVQVHWLRGASHFALGRTADAERAFDALLETQPLYQPNAFETSPPLKAAFERRSAAYQKTRGVTLGEAALQGNALTVPVKGAAAVVAVFARVPGDVEYRRTQLPVADGTASGPLGDSAWWERVGGAGRMELVLEARNASGVPVARTGDALKPLQFAVTPEQGRAAASVGAPAAPPPLPPVAEAASPEDASPAVSPLSLPLLLGGAAGLGTGGVAVLGAVLAGAAGGASAAVAGGIYYYVGSVVGSGKNRASLLPVYSGAVPAAVLLGSAGVVLLVLGVVAGGAGAAAMAARQVL